MPFCARCLGCSVGHILAFILFLTKKLPTIKTSLALTVIMGIDWFIQNKLKLFSNNYLRLITGIFGGLGVGAILWKLVNFLIIN